MTQDSNMHVLTHMVINDLQRAFTVSPGTQIEGFILSALVTVKRVHDQLMPTDCTATDIDPEEYCAAI